MKNDVDELFLKLNKSKFRSQFKLVKADIDYINKIGLEKIRSHAIDFVILRLKVYDEIKDGKQTPFKGHPVFKAQHATATCCRGCIEKWHHINKTCTLNEKQINYIVDVIMLWIEKEYVNSIK